MKRTLLIITAIIFALSHISWSIGQRSQNEDSIYSPLTESFIVGDTSFTVSVSMCNVLYRGLDNPVEVNILGYSEEDISVSINNNAAIRKVTSSSYIVTVPKKVTANEIIITLAVRTSEGGKILGSTKFKVLNVPPAKVKLFGSYTDGSAVPKQAILDKPYLSAELESGFFPFDDIKYTVSSYSFVYRSRGVTCTIDVTGESLNNEVLDIIKKSGVGALFCFTNIKISESSGMEKARSCIFILR